MPRRQQQTTHNNDRSLSRHGTGQRGAKRGGGGGSKLKTLSAVC